MIDVVGHFGSRFSYATVGAQVCRALEAAKRLGSVTNMDERWLDDYVDIMHARDRPTGTHLLMIADAQTWLFDAYSQKYDPQRISVFSSPNTDTMDEERVRVLSRTGLVLVPSKWCESSVRAASARWDVPPPAWMTRVPLGVSERFMTVPQARTRGERIRFVHFVTDFAWPGRKGTEELLIGWSRAQRAMDDRAELLLHVPVQIYESVHYSVEDLGLQNVTIQLASERGITESEIALMYEQTDVLVQPSRCEGFGLMILAGCVSQTPMITTYATGQSDFLYELRGWLGVAMSDRHVPLAMEEGGAPVVEPDAVATALVAATCSPVLDHLRREAARNEERAMQWCWGFAMGEWLDALERWRRSTS